MSSEVSEALARWRAGDAQAFERLHALATPSLKAFCLMLAGDEAADLIQDTWKQALVRIRSYREDRSFEAWLTTIAYRLWIDQKRRRDLERRLLEARLREQPKPEAPSDRHLLLREALAKLPSEERAAVLLYDLQGLSLRETADLLRVSHVTVHTLLASAHAALAKALKSAESP